MSKASNMILKISIIICFLTSCASMNSSYDCPNTSGVMCKSIDQINQMVDSGEIQRRDQKGSGEERSYLAFEPYTQVSETYSDYPLRHGETVQRVWLAPFEDEENNYHQASMIYTITKGGYWISSTVKSYKS